MSDYRIGPKRVALAFLRYFQSQNIGEAKMVRKKLKKAGVSVSLLEAYVFWKSYSEGEFSKMYDRVDRNRFQVPDDSDLIAAFAKWVERWVNN